MIARIRPAKIPEKRLAAANIKNAAGVPKENAREAISLASAIPIGTSFPNKLAKTSRQKYTKATKRKRIIADKERLLAHRRIRRKYESDISIDLKSSIDDANKSNKIKKERSIN